MVLRQRWRCLLCYRHWPASADSRSTVLSWRSCYLLLRSRSSLSSADSTVLSWRLRCVLRWRRSPFLNVFSLTLPCPFPFKSTSLRYSLMQSSSNWVLYCIKWTRIDTCADDGMPAYRTGHRWNARAWTSRLSGAHYGSETATSPEIYRLLGLHYSNKSREAAIVRQVGSAASLSSLLLVHRCLQDFNSSEAKASRVIIYKFPVKLPFPIHSGLQRASKSRHVHSNGVQYGRPAFHHLRMCQCVFTLYSTVLSLMTTASDCNEVRLTWKGKDKATYYVSEKTLRNGERLQRRTQRKRQLRTVESADDRLERLRRRR